MMIQVFEHEAPPVINAHFSKKRMVPAFDCGRSLRELLESLLKQLHFMIKILFVAHPEFGGCGGVLAKGLVAYKRLFKHPSDQTQCVSLELQIADGHPHC